MDRRSFLKVGATGIGAAAISPIATACAPSAPPTSLFSLGVAAGLHSDSEVVIWTRPDPDFDASVSSLDWEVSVDPSFSTITKSGTAAVTAATDHTVKVLVDGLPADSSVWYRFTAGSNVSPVGRARTLPAAGSSPTSLKLAFATCQMYSAGFYGAWRHAAAQDVDAVLFLGDYIYEVGLGPIGVRWESFSPAETLDAYRSKYRLYKSDPDLQAAHAAHPWMVIWDDHEVFNDYDPIVATPARMAAGYQAWFDYLPVMPLTGTQIYKSLRWGDLGEIMLTDSRQYRSNHPDAGLLGSFLDESWAAPDRSLFGTTQTDWLLSRFDAAQADDVRWKLFANADMMAPLRVIDLDTPEARAQDPSLVKHAGFYTLFDGWDGFPVERDRILGHLEDNSISDVLILTGDFHSWFQMGLQADFDDDTSPVVANEFVVSSISSWSAAITESLVLGANGRLITYPEFDYVDLYTNGYAILECTPSASTITYLAHDAKQNVEPTPVVKWTVPTGDTTAVKTLL